MTGWFRILKEYVQKLAIFSQYLLLKHLLKYTTMVENEQERVLRVEGFFCNLKALSNRKMILHVPRGVVYLIGDID